MKAAIEKRLEAVERKVLDRSPASVDLPEWLHWTTCAELDELENIYRAAAAADPIELGERDCHRVMAIYSAARVRMLEAPPEVRADPAAVNAYVREIEGQERPRWLGPPSDPDEYARR